MLERRFRDRVIIYEGRCLVRYRTCPLVNLFLFYRTGKGNPLDDHRRFGDTPRYYLSAGERPLDKLRDQEWRHGWCTRELSRNANRGAERASGVAPRLGQTIAVRASALHARVHACTHVCTPARARLYCDRRERAGGNELETCAVTRSEWDWKGELNSTFVAFFYQSEFCMQRVTISLSRKRASWTNGISRLIFTFNLAQPPIRSPRDPWKRGTSRSKGALPLVFPCSRYVSSIFHFSHRYPQFSEEGFAEDYIARRYLARPRKSVGRHALRPTVTHAAGPRG